MRQPPPRSTLFPYTTLFRSHRHPRPAHREVGGRRAAGRQRDVRDRKSTRLNSSHTVISYAVFCLKKKNKLITTFTDMVSSKRTATTYLSCSTTARSRSPPSS